MILIIDNYDSFTYNLVQQIEALGYETEVYLNDQINIDEIARKRPEKIVISPGPGTPADAGISSEVIKRFYQSIPILGVCLGHQCIGMNFGTELVHAHQVMHGKTSLVYHEKKGLFKDMPSPFVAARYHSLAIQKVKPPLRAIATTDDGTVMAIKHEEFPLYGIQFHPESFLSPHGKILIRNFLK